MKLESQSTNDVPAKLERIFMERDGSVVTFTIHCRSEYDAIQMYDRAVAAAKTGWVKLDISTKGAIAEGTVIDD